MPVTRLLRGLLVAAALSLPLGCAAPQPAVPERPAAPRTDPDFARGIAYAVDDLFTQLRRLPAFAPVARGALERTVDKALGSAEPTPRRAVIVVDVILESNTGQQTRATDRAEKALYEHVKSRFPQFDVLPMRAETLPRAEYVVTATMTPVAKEGGVHRLSMAMTEVASALVIAQSGVRIRDASLDSTPTAFYRDSPALVRDRVVEGQARTAETRPGSHADAVYLERLSTSSLVNEALVAFNRDDLAGALRYYEAAAKRPDGQQLRIYNGLYLAYWNTDRVADAESAFARIVSLGLATNNLAVKFLFRPGRTDFTPERKISGPYPFWLRQIAQQLASSRACLAVIGHSSHTGTEEFNDRLSVARAEAIKARLVAEKAELVGRLRTAGMGFRENLIGSGTDDARDALDRRVEFRVIDCGSG